MEDKSQQLAYFKEKLNKQLDSVKELLGEYRYKVFHMMVNECEDYDELRMMADIEMQLDSLEYEKKRVKDRLDRKDVSIKDIRLSTDRVQREIKKFEILEPEGQKPVISRKFDIITPDTLNEDIESDDILKEAINSMVFSNTMTPADEAKFLRDLQSKVAEITSKRIDSIDLDDDIFTESDTEDEEEAEDEEEEFDEMFSDDEESEDEYNESETEEIINSIPDDTSNDENEELIDLDMSPEETEEAEVEDEIDSMFEDDDSDEMSTEEIMSNALSDESLFEDDDSDEEEDSAFSEEDESEIIGDVEDELFEDTEESEEDNIDGQLDDCFDIEDEDDSELFEDDTDEEDDSNSMDEALEDESLFDDEEDSEESSPLDAIGEDPYAEFDSFIDEDDESTTLQEDIYNNLLSQPRDTKALSKSSSLSSSDISNIKPKEGTRAAKPANVFLTEDPRSKSTQNMFNIMCGLFDKSEIAARSLIKKTSSTASKQVQNIKKSSLINF